MIVDHDDSAENPPSTSLSDWMDTCMKYEDQSLKEEMSQEILENSSYEVEVVIVKMIGDIMIHLMNLVLNCLVNQNNSVIAECVRTHPTFADCNDFTLQILSALGTPDRETFLELFSETFAEPILNQFRVAVEESTAGMENPEPSIEVRLNIANIIANAHIAILRWEEFFNLDSINENTDVDSLKEKIEFKEYTPKELKQLWLFQNSSR